jgi:hypothetical protein
MANLTDQQIQSAFKGFMKLVQDDRVMIPITYAHNIANLTNISGALLSGQAIIQSTPEGVGKNSDSEV